MSRKISYSLATISDCHDDEGRKILRFTMRTTDGSDELWASKRADSKGTNMTEELIAFSMISYNVEETITTPVGGGGSNVELTMRKIEVKHPFEAFNKWSTKARNYVVAAWKRLATPDEDGLADFFASATADE